MLFSSLAWCPLRSLGSNDKYLSQCTSKQSVISGLDLDSSGYNQEGSNVHEYCKTAHGEHWQSNYNWPIELPCDIIVHEARIKRGGQHDSRRVVSFLDRDSINTFSITAVWLPWTDLWGVELPSANGFLANIPKALHLADCLLTVDPGWHKTDKDLHLRGNLQRFHNV